MKTNKAFLGKMNRFSVDFSINLLKWKLPSSKFWPSQAVNCLEHFLIREIAGYPTLKATAQKQWSMNILIVGKKRMQKINLEHRKKNYPTDVLSFPALDWSMPQGLPQMAQESDYSLGDIVICKDVLLKQAKQFQLSNMDEYLHLLVHGFLHLLGYDHEISQNEAKIMEKHEKSILDDISRTGSNSYCR